MVALPPFILLFDISALVAGNPRDWKEFSRLGECLLPQVVLQEMQFLCDRASETNLEPIAREFIRLYPELDWKETTTLATHPALQPAEGHTVSKKARIALAVAQTAYGVACNRPDALVVLIGNDQALLQRVQMLKVPNLCGVPLAALVQWNRTLRRPPVVSQHLQQLRSPVEATRSASGTKSVSPTQSAKPLPRPSSVESRRQPVYRRPVVRFPWFRLLISNLVVVGVTLVIAAAVWRALHPASFNRFWRQVPSSSRSSIPHLVSHGSFDQRPVTNN
jgi:hypothetical protein